MLTGRRWGGTAPMSSPSSRIRPSLGGPQPARRRNSLVLPQPEGPSSAKNSPWLMSSVSALTAATAPKRLVTASKRISTRAAPFACPRVPPPSAIALPRLTSIAYASGARGHAQPDNGRTLAGTASGRRRGRIRRRLNFRTPRCRAIIVAHLHDLARLDHDRYQTIEQRLSRHRRAQKFVHAELQRFENAPALAMPAEHDDRKIRCRKGIGRAHDAYQFRTVEQRHFPVEDNDVGGECANLFQRGDTIAGFVYLFHADLPEQAAYHVAHERVVFNHQHAELLDQDFSVFGIDLHGAR